MTKSTKDTALSLAMAAAILTSGIVLTETRAKAGNECHLIPCSNGGYMDGICMAYIPDCTGVCNMYSRRCEGN